LPAGCILLPKGGDLEQLLNLLAAKHVSLAGLGTSIDSISRSLKAGFFRLR
jgi:hypothetical protein